MKFTCSVIVNQPIDKVAKLFADPANLKEYQEGFVSKTLVSGVEGQAGAVSKMYYQTGKRSMEIEETILSNDLPASFTGSYHHKHMDNFMKSSFTALSEDQTRYEAEIEYTAFRGFVPKAMGFLFPGIFKKQVQKWLDNFKVFAENGE